MTRSLGKAVRERESRPMHTCVCGKLAYESRKGAKAAGKRRDPNGGSSAYLCTASGREVYHWGHLPECVKTGKVSRDEVTSRRNLPTPRRTP